MHLDSDSAYSQFVFPFKIPMNEEYTCHVGVNVSFDTLLWVCLGQIAQTRDLQYPSDTKSSHGHGSPV